MYRLNSIFIWWGRKKKWIWDKTVARALKILCCIVFYFETISSCLVSELSFWIDSYKRVCVYVSCISKQSIKVQDYTLWVKVRMYYLYLWKHIFEMTLIDFHYRFLSVCFLIKFVVRCRGIWFRFSEINFEHSTVCAWAFIK